MVEAPKVHCAKDDVMVPIWHCLGSYMQGKESCPELLQAVYDGPNNRAEVKCKAQTLCARARRFWRALTKREKK